MIERKVTITTPNHNSSSHLVVRVHLNNNDVLSGRGGWVQQYPGNIKFRRLIRCYHQRYHEADRDEKSTIVQTIVQSIKSMDPPGRFLREVKPDDTSDSLEKWVELDQKNAFFKTRKAIRSVKKGGRLSTIQSPSSSTCPSPTNISLNNDIDTSSHHKIQNSTPEGPVPSPDTRHPLILCTSNELFNRSTNNLRMQYYKLKFEETVVLPPTVPKIDNRAKGRTSTRTYSDERTSLLTESQILSLKSSISSEPGFFHNFHVSGASDYLSSDDDSNDDNDI